MTEALLVSTCESNNDTLKTLFAYIENPSDKFKDQILNLIALQSVQNKDIIQNVLDSIKIPC